jgi:hypothetical protein
LRSSCFEPRIRALNACEGKASRCRGMIKSASIPSGNCRFSGYMS